jgi:SAM-dependent methyltransferase
MKVFGKEYASSYDLLYGDKDYGKEVEFLEWIFTKYALGPKTILDLGCGTGGHALELAKRGYEVTGIDRSKEMLDIAIEKAGRSNLDIKFVKGDIADLELRKRFDAAISMFAVMSYQATDEAIRGVCETARAHLSGRGIFIFDCWHAPAVLNEKPAARVKEVKLTGKEKMIRFTEPVMDARNHTVDVRFRLCRTVNGCLTDRAYESHLMRFLFREELSSFLKESGFDRIEFHPFMEPERELSDSDWNMLVVARAGTGGCDGKR